MDRKRALIVDDSRSARFMLSKVLRDQQLSVDTVDSAEAALVYLDGNHPDVIFMDHLMPGMDGFAAVDAIHQNPDTASIPIMMYTSQKGELYMDQARQHGTVGILPKQTKPVKINRMLKTLHLLPDDDTQEPESQSASVAVQHDVVASKTERESQHADLSVRMRTRMATQLEAQQRTIAQLTSRYDAIAHRLSSTLDIIGDKLAQSRSRPGAPGWGVLGVLLLLLVLAGVTIVDNRNRFSELEDRIGALGNLVTASATRSSLQSRFGAQNAAVRNTAGATAPQAVEALMWGINRNAVYPYGETPLNRVRLESLRGLLARLETLGVSGTLEISVYSGNFCLSQTSAGYALAAPGTTVQQCEVIGNPIRDSETVNGPAYADFLSRRAGSSIKVVITPPSPQAPIDRQRIPGDDLTAGQWNRVATTNNRIQYTLTADR